MISNNFIDKAHVIITIQPRIAGSNMAMQEIPAGMFDPGDESDNGSLSFTAQRELREECGIEVTPADMRPLYTTDGGVYTSCGASDEQIQFFYCKKLMDAHEMAQLEGRIGGDESEREKITLRLVPLRDLLTATQDIKAMCAAALYNNLEKSHSNL